MYFILLFCLISFAITILHPEGQKGGDYSLKPLRSPAFLFGLMCGLAIGGDIELRLLFGGAAAAIFFLGNAIRVGLCVLAHFPMGGESYWRVYAISAIAITGISVFTLGKILDI